jgi:hypothetical protein
MRRVATEAERFQYYCLAGLDVTYLSKERGADLSAEPAAGYACVRLHGGHIQNITLLIFTAFRTSDTKTYIRIH